MLKTIAQFLRSGEKVSFTLSRSGDGLRLLVTPILAPEDESADERIKQIRAMLAQPIVINATADTLDAEGKRALEGVVVARNDIAATYETLVEDMRNQAKSAASIASRPTSSKTAGKGTAKATKATDTKPSQPAPTDPAEEEDESGAGEHVADPAERPSSSTPPPPPAPIVDLFGGQQ